MIKEKHEKTSDAPVVSGNNSSHATSGGSGGISVKEEPGASEIGSPSAPDPQRIKKEDDSTTTNKNVKNGTLMGCNNEIKTDPDDLASNVGATVNANQAIKEEDLPTDFHSIPTSGSDSGSVQQLPSNVVNKQPSTMEVQYMQQQSQIFVFSTLWANTGADEVIQGRYPSIIAYHCSQPGTKKYLEKNPLKMAQFTRQGPGQWLNSLSAGGGGAAMSKNKQRSPPAPPNTNQSKPLDFLSADGLEDIGLSDSCLPWESKEAIENGLQDVNDMQPSLQGVKVPDENLTPQQRQHREEQLATIRKLQQMLCPENQGGQGAQPHLNSDGIEMMPSMDWKLQQQQFKPGPRGAPPMSGPRLQGPPPPYHQTPRSASVPIALQSPNPVSPNNPTSNLSLPSPSRASSALNSPADTTRPFGLSRHMSNTGQSPTSQDSPNRGTNHSNPGTPISSAHMSPSVNPTTAATTEASAENLFGRTLQSMAQQQKQGSTSIGGPGVIKEPNLMPVPSPQQIQYLNAFEGQELIIQKQPNTSLNKDANMISPPMLSTTMDSGFPPSSNTDMGHSRLSGPNTPTSMDGPVGSRFMGTPSDGCRFQIPSPHTPTNEKPRLSVLSPQTGGPQLPPQPDGGNMMDVARFPGPTPSPKMGNNFMNVSPSSGGGGLNACARGADNVPLNPNCTSSMAPKVSHFDPISSLAQMSQQLTNSVASSLNGQGHHHHHQGMMNFVGSPSMHMMEMGPCGMDMDPTGVGGNMMGMSPMQGPPHGFHPNSPMGGPGSGGPSIGPIRSLSPKLPGVFPNHMPMPRMMSRSPAGGPPSNPYNGANVQVKPNAPNTIQYMPAKSQVGAPGPPRGPPSLEFLQRYANPNAMNEKNMQYFQNCGGGINNGPMPMGHGPIEVPGPVPGMQDVPMMGPGPGMGNGPMMGNMGPMSGGNMIPMGHMRPMRPPPPQGMMRMPMGGFSGPNNPGPGGEVMFNHPNQQMFVGGPKGSPMGQMGAPDASQPLPPSMGQGNSFKNSPFVGPTTADPNYAQQFHNFQQQLYATGTRNQMGQAMGLGPGPPGGPGPHQQQPYFPK